ncbi:MAG: ATP-binding cassette domain-containing protein [Zetaproteobacteria bacterium]|nr:ATP-binding cassette domain-containing protein [Zetaproteobacteria bacterium]
MKVDMIRLQNIQKTFHRGSAVELKSLDGLCLNVDPGQFVILLGSNGAGKSTLFNILCGSLAPDLGTVHIGQRDVTQLKEYQRAKYIGRVFQDPLKGSADKLTIEENLALAMKRNACRGLRFALQKGQRGFFQSLLEPLELGLEKRLDHQMGLLSGGQRQVVTLLMATLNDPEVLLLDEHTAALDPVTAEKVMCLTHKLVEKRDLTALMVTHNLQHALAYGDRVIVMHRGKVAHDIFGQDKAHLSMERLRAMFDKLET